MLTSIRFVQPSASVRLLDAVLGRVPPRALTNRVSMALLRALARLSLPLCKRGRITVVIVNFGTGAFLAETLRALRLRTAGAVEVIVLDNPAPEAPSLDAPADVRVVRFRRNIGHAAAANVGFLLATGETVVCLDVDAFPITDDWVEKVVGPLRRGATVSGAQLWRPFVHPCCLAITKRRFVTAGHTFGSNYSPARDALGVDAWDVGESISIREAAEGGGVHLIPVTAQRGPGDVGTVFGDCVYHNFYSSRHLATEDRLIEGVAADDAAAAWAEAVARYLPAD